MNNTPKPQQGIIKIQLVFTARTRFDSLFIDIWIQSKVAETGEQLAPLPRPPHAGRRAVDPWQTEAQSVVLRDRAGPWGELVSTLNSAVITATQYIS